LADEELGGIFRDEGDFEIDQVAIHSPLSEWASLPALVSALPLDETPGFEFF
jgi:hypothetical protein